MLNSLWRNVFPPSRHVLVLSSILTVTSSGSSSRAFISDFGHCQARKVRFIFFKIYLCENNPLVKKYHVLFGLTSNYMDNFK